MPGLVDHAQVIFPAAGGAPGEIQRPCVDGAAAGNADFAERAVDLHAGQNPERQRDRVDERLEEAIGRREQADVPAREGVIDRQRDDESRFAPSAAGDQRDAAVGGDHIHRLELRRVRRNLGQGDRASRHAFPPAREARRRPLRESAELHPRCAGKGAGGVSDALAEGGEATLFLLARESRDPRALAVEGLGGDRSSAGQEVGGGQRRQRPESPLGPPRIDGALDLQRRSDAHESPPASSARYLSTSISSSAALAPR